MPRNSVLYFAIQFDKWANLINQNFRVVLLKQSMVKDFNDIFNRHFKKNSQQISNNKIHTLYFQIWRHVPDSLRHSLWSNLGQFYELKVQSSYLLCHCTIPICQLKLQNILQLLKYLQDPEDHRRSLSIRVLNLMRKTRQAWVWWLKIFLVWLLWQKK